MTTQPDLDLADLRAKAEAATPGPWTMGQLASYTGDGVPVRYFYRGKAETHETRTPVRDCPGGAHCDEDASFIAAANPAVIIALLDRLAAAEAERDGLLADFENRFAERSADR